MWQYVVAFQNKATEGQLSSKVEANGQRTQPPIYFGRAPLFRLGKKNW